MLRLESAGWFVSRWEVIDPSSAGRPRTRRAGARSVVRGASLPLPPRSF